MLLVKVCKVLKVRRWHALARQVVGLADTCWCGRVVGLLHMPKDTAHKQTCAVYFAKVFGTSITAWAVIQTLNTLAGKSECQHVSVYVTVCLDAVHFRFTAPRKYTCDSACARHAYNIGNERQKEQTKVQTCECISCTCKHAETHARTNARKYA